MSAIAYSVVDAFTATPFKGNPAAVIILDPRASLSDTTLQCIAAEFNLSETAFISPIDATKGRFGLRWFTPAREVVLCGHATLASASVLFSEHDILPEDVKLIHFDTLSGVLAAQYLPDGRIELEFPAGETVIVDDPLREKIGEVLRRASKTSPHLNIRFVGSGKGTSFGHCVLIEVDGIDLEKAAIKSDPFLDLSPRHRSVIVTQRGRGSETFISRVFCPASGIPEDPVTGSAHCILGPYWAKELEIQGTTNMVGKQVSARSGVIGVIWDREKETCRLQGNATLVAKGELYLPN